MRQEGERREMTSFGLVRRKRPQCPEWLWWFACNPIPFWNEIFPMYRIFIRPLTWLLSCDCQKCMGEYWQEAGND